MDKLNTDFGDTASADALHQFYLSQQEQDLARLPSHEGEKGPTASMIAEEQRAQEGKAGRFTSLALVVWILSQRLTLNYSRNMLAFGIRAGMYVGMGLMVGQSFFAPRPFFPLSNRPTIAPL